MISLPLSRRSDQHDAHVLPVHSGEFAHLLQQPEDDPNASLTRRCSVYSLDASGQTHLSSDEEASPSAGKANKKKERRACQMFLDLSSTRR